MYISDLISKLRFMQSEHGNLRVVLAADAEGNSFHEGVDAFPEAAEDLSTHYIEIMDVESFDSLEAHCEAVNCVVIWP